MLRVRSAEYCESMSLALAARTVPSVERASFELVKLMLPTIVGDEVWYSRILPLAVAMATLPGAAAILKALP